MADQADHLRQLASKARGSQPIAKANPLASVTAPFQGRRARVIAVSSGKGGVGKTNLSVNLALAFRQLGQEVLLFDADLGLANADIILGIHPRLTLQHFMRGERSLIEILAEGPLGLKVIPAGNGIASLADLGPQERERLLSHFSLLEQMADIVIVDTGAGISKNVVAFAGAADDTLVVCTPEPTARLDAYGLIKTLFAQNYGGHMRLLVNMTDSQREGDEVGKLMSELASRFLGAHLDYLGCVPRDRAVGRAVTKQTPFMIAFPDSPASRRIRELALRLLEAPSPGRGGIKGFLQRLSGLLKGKA